jgi:citrate synthase
VSRIPAYIKRAKDKNDRFTLKGFGHRIVNSVDPRAKIMRELCATVFQARGIENDSLFSLAQALEKIALQDDYFIERRLFPNVYFYSGILLKAIGIPPAMFPCIVALAHTVGWMVQWEEMITDSDQKIGRPRQLYVGHARRDVPMYDPRD